MTLVTEQIKLAYRLTFNSPFHFGTGLRRGLVHRTVAKNHEDYLIVPGTTLKGVVRERCEQLCHSLNLATAEPHDAQNVETRVPEARLSDPDIVARIFGSRFRAGSLFFDDAHLAEFSTGNESQTGPAPETAIGRTFFDGTDENQETIFGKYKLRQVETRTQVSLSRLTRTAKGGQLYTSEYGIRQLCFDGAIYGYLEGFKDGLEHSSYALLLLLAGLLSVDRLGGMKSTGAGEVALHVTQLQINGQPQSDRTILNQLEFLPFYEELVRGENS